jgi:hypothetical protein
MVPLSDQPRIWVQSGHLFAETEEGDAVSWTREELDAAGLGDFEFFHPGQQVRVRHAPPDAPTMCVVRVLKDQVTCFYWDGESFGQGDFPTIALEKV